MSVMDQEERNRTENGIRVGRGAPGGKKRKEFGGKKKFVFGGLVGLTR